MQQRIFSCLDTILSLSSAAPLTSLLVFFSSDEYVQSIEFTKGRLRSRCRNISKKIKRNGRHWSQILCLTANGMNTDVNVRLGLSIWDRECRFIGKKNMFLSEQRAIA